MPWPLQLAVGDDRWGRGAGVVVVRQWRHKRSELPTAACLQEIKHVNSLRIKHSEPRFVCFL
jgi:hypothetical protein